MLLGLLEGPRARRIITPFCALFGCWFAFAALVVWAAAMASTWGLSTADVRSSPIASWDRVLRACLPW